ncbi:conserved exported hypothetical protein [Sphingomonas sp. EC-HK361]|uniref:heavy-metal-associated domain-containing protein n=1 Tax=Sphingomonas sp. EC-HK361 TaxID=2038397 RepID=UPI0012593CC1|nr:heavy-metal-associated domain-containing protein [Sphingomonas sp. EC-HK361]VVT03002.1 conserved exported hypothetical protein [Sphingomonas sp. EC-HK361]
MRLRTPVLALATAALAFGGAAVMAQIEGGSRGVAPIDSSGNFEVSGVTVDTSGKSADAARYAGWRLAQRKAWVQLSNRLGAGGGLVSDGTLDSLVSAVVVENEQIGPNRYIAKLGVLFDRDRAGSILGVVGTVNRSAAMVVIPVQWSGGVGQVFEQRSDWQEAWARYRTGNSTIDYVRPVGTGPDPLLLNVGQTERPGRGWWRTVLDQYGASDVLIPVVTLYRQWPGGPIVGVFQARQGPDNRKLAQFVLKVNSAAGLPALLDAGVKRIDETYQAALSRGLIRADPGLMYRTPEPTPTPTALPTDLPAAVTTTAATATTAFTVQFDTPDVGAVTATEGALLGIPGVSSASTSSLALGGISLMRVGYAGAPEALRAALEARGWQVLGSGTTLRIRRGPAPQPRPTPTGTPTAG